MKKADLIWVKDFGVTEPQWDLLTDVWGNLVDDLNVGIELIRKDPTRFIGNVGLSNTRYKKLDKPQWLY